MFFTCIVGKILTCYCQINIVELKVNECESSDSNEVKYLKYVHTVSQYFVTYHQWCWVQTYLIFINEHAGPSFVVWVIFFFFF